MQQELVERARRGDHDAFAALAGASIFRLDAADRLILCDPDQAKDAVQQTLVRAWRDLPTLRSSDRFDAWLHRLLYRACIDEARRLRRHRVDVELTPIHSPLVGDMTSSINDRDQLERRFSRLEPEARLETAKSRLHRALQSMRAALDADDRPRSEIPEGRPA
jgi:DNA-directed RNA polymerase specialized sigma24 family protein